MEPSQLAEEALNTILDRCTAAGLLVEPIVHKDWNVEADVGNGAQKVKVLVYFNSKGKLTPKVQGKKTPVRELVELQLYGDEPVASPFLPETVTAWIGVDESGKGDYFGPLTAAAASILARDEFVRRMAQLEEQAGCALPLGASNEHGILQST